MPTRLRDLKRAAEKFGLELETPNNGSHWKFTRQGKVYPVPAHNALNSEIGDKYLRGLCRCFDIKLEDLKAAL